MNSSTGFACESRCGSLNRFLKLRDDGYFVAENMVPKPDIERLRDLVGQYFGKSGRFQHGGKFQLRALHRSQAIADIILSDRILTLLKQVTLPSETLLTGECDLMMNTTSGWHKDVVGDFGRDQRIYADQSFRVYKIGVYLQDQSATSPIVFKVRPGSHRQANGQGLPQTPIPVKAGDVVVFDVRIDHAGQLPTHRDKVLKKLIFAGAALFRIDPEPWFTRTRSMMKRQRGATLDRIGVFISFGAADPWTFAYEAANRARHGPAPLNKALDAKLRRNGIRMIYGSELDESDEGPMRCDPVGAVVAG